MGASDGTQDSGTAGLSGGRTLRRLALWLVALVVAAGLAYGGGFGVYGIHVGGLRQPAEIGTADGIVVLTGGRQRIAAAVDLLKGGKGRRLLISGVNPVTDRADLLAASGADPALFACCVDIDRAALDTIGNAEETAKWLNDHDYGSAIVVTSNYHIPRSLLEMHRTVEGVRLIPYPVVNTDYGRFGWIGDGDAMRVLFTEYTKFVGALVRGTLAPLPHGRIEAHAGG